MNLQTFESMAAIGVAASKVSWKHDTHNIFPETKTLQESARLSQYGDESLVRQSEELLNQLMDVTTEIQANRWTPNPYGAYPVVPEYLAGTPNCMRHLTMVDADLPPTTVYVCLGASAAIRHEALIKRGVAILALVMKLQAIRPIELVVMSGDYSLGTAVVIKINTKPLDLATACFALADPSFLRVVTFSVLAEMQNNKYIGAVVPVSVWKELLDIQETDLVIPGVVSEHEDPIIDPVKWINEQLARFQHGEVEEYA